MKISLEWQSDQSSFRTITSTPTQPLIQAAKDIARRNFAENACSLKEGEEADVRDTETERETQFR
jgi:hypothetical protein